MVMIVLIVSISVFMVYMILLVLKIYILDYSETGGAPLLGVGGVSVICHGGSSSKAIRNAISVAAQAVRSDMVAQTASRLSASINDASEEAS